MTSTLGPLGVWGTFDHLPAPAVIRYAQAAERLGYDCLWVNESTGREPFALLGALTGATRRILLGVGVASIYARDAIAVHAAASTIAELSGGRFILGLGVSHRSSVEARGHVYTSPLSRFERYLDDYERAPYRAPQPPNEPLLVLAALRERALRLAAKRGDGVFPYLVTEDYLRHTRALIDDVAASLPRSRPLLIVTLPIVTLTEAGSARQAARAYLGGHLQQPNYRRSLLAMGFSQLDLANGGSDGLVDELVAWGDRAQLLTRIESMHRAGADHVAVIPVSSQGFRADLTGLELVAPTP